MILTRVSTSQHDYLQMHTTDRTVARRTDRQATAVSTRWLTFGSSLRSLSHHRAAQFGLPSRAALPVACRCVCRRRRPAAERPGGGARVVQDDEVARIAQVTNVARTSRKKMRERAGTRVVV